MKKLLLFLALPLLLLTACEDDENTNTGSGKQIPVSMVLREGKDSVKVTWAYDSSDRLTKATIVEDDYSDEISYFYNGSDLIKIEGVENGSFIATTTFTTTGNVIVAMEREYDMSGIQLDSTKRTVTLNADGLPSKITEDEKKQPESYSIYSYDSRKNISKIEEYDYARLRSTEQFEYNDKAGVHSQTNTPKWIAIYLDDIYYDDALFSFNNPVKETNIQSQFTSNTYTFTYLYNENNFPTTINCDEGDQTPVSYKITYRK